MKITFETPWNVKGIEANGTEVKDVLNKIFDRILTDEIAMTINVEIGTLEIMGGGACLVSHEKHFHRE